jgi:hypothetical protein
MLESCNFASQIDSLHLQKRRSREYPARKNKICFHEGD